MIHKKVFMGEFLTANESVITPSRAELLPDLLPV
jgi:hypothetical protein